MNDPNEQPILSLSYERDPKEQVKVMLEAGRRFMTVRPRSWYIQWWIIFALTSLFILLMESYRRFILMPWLGAEDAPDIGDVLFTFAPVWVIFLFALVLALKRRNQQIMKALEARLAKNVPITVEIYPAGLMTSSSQSKIWLDWTAIRQISVIENRIVLDTEGYANYIPQRAFIDKTDMLEKAKEIRSLWHQGIKQAGPSQNS